jgi:hypothetical protein
MVNYQWFLLWHESMCSTDACFMKYNLLQLSQLLLTAAAQLSLPWTFISGYLFGSSLDS